MNNDQSKESTNAQTGIEEVDLDTVEQVLGGATLTLRPLTTVQLRDLSKLRSISTARLPSRAVLAEEVDWH